MRRKTVDLRNASLSHAAWTARVADALRASGRTVTEADPADRWHLAVDGRPVRVVTDNRLAETGNVALEIVGHFAAGRPGVALEAVDWWVYVDTVREVGLLLHLPSLRAVVAASDQTPRVTWATGSDGRETVRTLSLLVPLAALRAGMPRGRWSEFSLQPAAPSAAQPSLL